MISAASLDRQIHAFTQSPVTGQPTHVLRIFTGRSYFHAAAGVRFCCRGGQVPTGCHFDEIPLSRRRDRNLQGLQGQLHAVIRLRLTMLEKTTFARCRGSWGTCYRTRRARVSAATEDAAHCGEHHRALMGRGKHVSDTEGSGFHGGSGVSRQPQRETQRVIPE